VEQRTFNQLLAAAVKNGASDIHLKAGAPPALRINGSLLPVKVPALQPDDTQRVASYILQGVMWQGDINLLKDVDTSYHIDDVGRFRVNIYRTKSHLGLVLRVIPPTVPNLEQLGLPPVLRKICEESRGLILVTGVTGSGKSSTLAAMIDYMNNQFRDHILTIEDPIEFIHQDKLARVSQREIGPDSSDFGRALKSALRQDPDTILVGEMRDLETIDIAMKAAETGHLVLSTLHTNDAAKTITRLVEVYPHDAHDGVRSRIAENLKAIISQRLLPRAGGKGRVVALEVLVATESIKEFIRENRLAEITDYLSKNTDIYGTQSFDQHLSQLYRSGVITLDTAKAATTNPSDFERALAFD
jgi:twitching motility protein PilT